MTTSEIACTYAALCLFDDDVEVTAENIQKLLKAANVKVETYWPGLFENMIKEKGGVGPLICGACKGGGGNAAASGGGDDTSGDKKRRSKRRRERIKRIIICIWTWIIW
eukprot:43732_1